MDRLGAALEEAQHIVAARRCPTCGHVYTRRRRAWWANHLLHCGHPPRFTAPEPVMCDHCGGPCHPAHARYLRGLQSNKAA